MMMRRTACLTVLATMLLSFAAVDGAPAKEKKSKKKSDEWTDMFCCEDLDCWDVITCEVEFEDGVLLVKSGNGLVQTKRQYADFVLRFECKALDAEMWDSGIYFRYTEVPEGRPWPRKYQVNLRKGMEGNVDGIEGANSRGLVKPREWNRFTLTVKGDKVDLEINGEQAWQAEGLAGPDSGFISLQAEVPQGGQHRFRNIYITEL